MFFIMKNTGKFLTKTLTLALATYPRYDTCSFCDEMKVKIDALQAEINNRVTKDDTKKLNN